MRSQASDSRGDEETFMWIWLTLASAVMLGLYEVFKKLSVKDNPVAPVLYCNAAVCAAIWVPIVLASRAGWISSRSTCFVPALSAAEHTVLFIKSLIVGSSWSMAYFAIKHLPVSIASPIRSTSPFWTIAISVGMMGEMPSSRSWIGMILVLGSFYLLSILGRWEGIRFHRNVWVAWMMAATIMAAISSVYDKYLLQTRQFSVAAVQAWFSIYLLVVLFPLLVTWWLHRDAQERFRWKHSIAAIALCLLAADWLYFSALRNPEAMVSIVSSLRRTSIVVSVAIGTFYLGEKNGVWKLAAIAVMLIGVAVLSSG
jgi:bacterial/archaeal transporter family protein